MGSDGSMVTSTVRQVPLPMEAQMSNGFNVERSKVQRMRDIYELANRIVHSKFCRNAVYTISDQSRQTDNAKYRRLMNAVNAHVKFLIRTPIQFQRAQFTLTYDH